MAKKVTRLKAAAAAYTPQSREQVSTDIRKIGDIQRELIRIETGINDQIAVITNKETPRIEALKAELTTLQKGVQTWCEANRSDITSGGKTKTANLVTGEVSWRIRPPSVSIARGMTEKVLEVLKKMGLSDFIRSKETINKEALGEEMQKEDGKVKNIPGLSLIRDEEDFSITPFEQEVN